MAQGAPLFETPLVAAVDMGYGHLRAAWPLADALSTTVTEIDRPPFADASEQVSWRRLRLAYERTSRWSQAPWLGAPLARALDAITWIDHLHPYRDLSSPTRQTRALDRMLRGGLGRGLAARLHESGKPMVATYFVAAIAAEAAGCERVHCVVTDSDVSRAWVPLDPAASRIRWLVPTARAHRRLRAYGVPRENVELTGFPLPPQLLGGPELKVARANLAGRLVRLDPSGLFREPRAPQLELALGALPSSEEGRPPLLAYAVGGAGAQAEVAREFLPSLRPLVEAGRLRIALVAGTRADVAERFHEWLRGVGLEPDGTSVEVLHESTFGAYYKSSCELLARTDVLWTKPSELTFYAALGLPMVLGKPVGRHESYNRRWLRERGAGLKQRDPRFAGQWLVEWLDEGLLASAAWTGFTVLPAAGTYRIVEAVTSSASPISTSHDRLA